MNIKKTLCFGTVAFAVITVAFSVQHRPMRVKCDASKKIQAIAGMSLNKGIAETISAFPIPPMSGEIKVAGGLRYFRGYLAVRGQSTLAREPVDSVFDWLRRADLYNVGIQEEPGGIRRIGTHMPLRVEMILDSKMGTVTVFYGEGVLTDLEF